MMPNGRIPVLQDHWNNGKVVWESNAMLKYIADRYDTKRTFLVDDDDLKTDMDTCESLRPSCGYDLNLDPSGLFYQASHQGPYFGQLQWFSFYHNEQVPSAVTRSVAPCHRELCLTRF